MAGQFKMRHVAAMGLALAGLALPAASYAQDKPAAPAAQQAGQRPNRGQQGEPGAALIQRLHDQMAKLDLTDDQKTQVEKILADVKQEVETLRADVQANKVPQAEVRDRMQTLTQGIREKIMQVLTPEQRQKAREQMAAAGPMGIVERIQKAAAELNLTDDQKTKIEAIVADIREQSKAIREKAQGDRQAAMEEMQKLLRDSRERVMQLLTPEQSQKVAEMLKERPNGGANRPAKPAAEGAKPAQ